MSDLTWGPVVDLVASLQAAEVRAALDPADLNLPAAWVSVEGLQAANLRHDLAVDVAVYLIAPDQDYHRALEALGAMFNAVVPEVFTPDGRVTPSGVVLPGSDTPLPALRLPLRLHEPEDPRPVEWDRIRPGQTWADLTTD